MIFPFLTFIETSKLNGSWKFVVFTNCYPIGTSFLTSMFNKVKLYMSQKSLSLNQTGLDTKLTT